MPTYSSKKEIMLECKYLLHILLVQSCLSWANVLARGGVDSFLPMCSVNCTVIKQLLTTNDILGQFLRRSTRGRTKVTLWLGFTGAGR